MSRDNTVLIVGLRVNRRRIWVVLHVQAHELFGDPQWTKWWLGTHPSQYTTRWRTAYRIAQQMAGGIDRLEHGVIRFFSAASMDDCVLRNGELEIVEPVEMPSRWEDTSDENDWKRIE